MDDLKLALKAAAAGSAILSKYFQKEFKVKKKGRINLVTEVDLKAQKAICALLKKYAPNDALLAEEENLSTNKDAKRRWIIDPLDGTTNYAHGYPKFAVSIGLEVNGKMKLGVIHDPWAKEIFYAQKGKGAFVNEKRIRVSKAKTLEESLLVTGFPYDLYNPEYNNLPFFNHMTFKAQAIRRDGSAALNLAYVAAGRFDGLWELSLKPWDYSAGWLIVEEAGGKVTHISGRAYAMGDHAMLATNGKIHRSLQEELAAK